MAFAVDSMRHWDNGHSLPTPTGNFVQGLFAFMGKRTEADLTLGVRTPRQDPSFRRLNAWLWGQYIKSVLC